MADTDTCEWAGGSGTKYKYWWHALPFTYKTGQPGNYIYAKIVQNQWVPIYIGEGDLGERVGPNHHKASCIQQKGATHIHGHTQGDQQARTAEETDLLSNYTQAYAPTGCNEKKGG